MAKTKETQEKEVEVKKETPEVRVKAGTKVYKYKYKTGGLGLSYKNKREHTVNIRFEKGTYTAKDPETIEYLDDLIEQQIKSGDQRIFTLSQYEKKFAPEKEFIELEDGNKIHKSVLLQALEFAKARGFDADPSDATRQIEQAEGISRVQQGTQTSEMVEKSIIGNANDALLIERGAK